MDMIATTFDIAMFLSRDGDCGQGTIAAKILPSADSVAPNGQRISGERRGEADERVRCTLVLGRSSRP
jgi:hypothetical protein